MIGVRWGIFPGLLLSLTGYTLLAASPVHYIENKNQWPAGFHYVADFPQMKVMLKDASVFFVQHAKGIADQKSGKRLQTSAPDESHAHDSRDRSLATFELVFIDALPASINASHKQVTRYNYYSGTDRSKWATNVNAYGEVVYDGLYEGIDLKMYSDNDQMKYDWVVSPCADTRRIRFMYKGVEHIGLRDENLVVETKLGEVVETKPYAYQVVNGQRRSVQAAFDIDDGIVSFIFPQGYDTNYELVIDPFLIFSSYSGSTYDNWGNTATPDSKGNLYSGGMVDNTFGGSGFPTTPGAFQETHQGGKWDVGILKYDSSGANLLYVTYLGGAGAETPQSLVVNSNDELLVLGATSSDDFPGTTTEFLGGTEVDPLGDVLYPGGTDLFIARFSVDGSQLLASTYLGGTENDGINFVSGDVLFDEANAVSTPLAQNYGDEFRGDIITTAEGFVYLVSNTMSDDFPVINTDASVTFNGGTHDAIVAKLNSNLSPVWTRLVGGTAVDVAYSIKITASGNLLIGGGTTSTDIAGMNGLITTAPGEQNGWIMELLPTGDQVVNATYIGTAGYDQVYFIDIATNGDVLAYGQTNGNYPVTPGVYSRPNSGQFLHRLTPDLKTTVFSTTFGTGSGSPDISPTAFLVSQCDNIYMAGWGGVINFRRDYIGGGTTGLQVTPDAWQSHTSGNDFYFLVLTGDGKEQVYGSFLGGPSSFTHVDGGTSRFDKRGVVYHAVCAGCGGFPDDFPSYNVPASRSENRSANCNNAAFKFDLSSLRAVFQTNNTALTLPGYNLVCLPDSIVFQNVGVGGETFEWTFGDGQTLNVTSKDNITHYYENPGTYTVKLKAIDHTTCVGVDSTTTLVNIVLPKMQAGLDRDICFGTSTRITATGAVSYAWKTIDNRFKSNEAEPLVAPGDSTIYHVTMIDADGCVGRDSLTVNVVPGIDLDFDFQKFHDCNTRPYLKVRNLSELKEGEEAVFLFGDGSTSSEDEPVHIYERDGIYTVTLRATNEFCVYQATRDVPIVTLKIPNVITPGSEDGLNDSFKLVYGDPPLSKSDLDIHVKFVDRWGVTVFESKNYIDDWKGGDLDEGVYYYEVELVGETKCKGWIHLIK